MSAQLSPRGKALALVLEEGAGPRMVRGPGTSFLETIGMLKGSGKKLVLSRESLKMIAEITANPHLERVQGGISNAQSGGECTCGISSCGPCSGRPPC